MKLRAALLFSAISISTFAQQPAPAPPQTARQALIEMITGGQKAASKHLTVEVQQLLANVGNKSSYVLAMFDSIRSQAGTEIQTFDTGSILLSANEPREHAKLEARIENDDLTGEEDTLELSFHLMRDGKEDQAADWGAFLSHVAVNMKRQQGIWRLNKIGVGLEFPLGDPEFLKKTFFKIPDQATGVGVVAGSGHLEANTEQHEINVLPEQLVAWLSFSERSFAQEHPDIGFSCSLSELTQNLKFFESNQELSSGTYKGYKLSLTGCEGKPAGSFHIVAEPIVQGAGAKAFCTDATQNLRASDDGRGSSCIASGHIFRSNDVQSDELSSWGVDVHVVPDKSKR